MGFISRLPVDRVGTMVCPRLTGPAAFFATITILSLFSFSPVEMRDPLAVTISRMKKMYQEKEGDGVQDTPTPWMLRRPADSMDSNNYVLRRYLKRAATLDNIISAIERNSDMHREAREDWMTRLG